MTLMPIWQASLAVKLHVITVLLAFSAVKAGDIATHRVWMLGVYTGSLIINGAMNIFVVDGITRDVFFGG